MMLICVATIANLVVSLEVALAKTVILFYACKIYLTMVLAKFPCRLLMLYRLMWSPVSIHGNTLHQKIHPSFCYRSYVNGSWNNISSSPKKYVRSVSHLDIRAFLSLFQGISLKIIDNPISDLNSSTVA